MSLYPEVYSILSHLEIPRAVNTFIKVAGYNMNMPKSVSFQYTKDLQTVKGIRQIISFTIASETTYLGLKT